MQLLQFLAWVATQGIKHIPKKLLIQAFNSFKGKLPGKDVILKTAKNLWDDVIKKTSTKDLTKQIRQDIKKDKLLDFTVPLRNKQSAKFVKEWNKAIPPKQMENIIEKLEKIIPKEFNKFIPKTVPKTKQIVEKLKPIKPGEKTIVPIGPNKPPFIFTKIPKPKGPAEIIYGKFPKKPPGKAEGGIASLEEGVSTQKEIDKALVAIEKLKPGLMPESYEALIELYKDKQKELDTGIMESAGGLGEMLGEGGRAGFKKGSTRRRLQKDYESYAKFSDYLKSAPPNFWLFPEKYGIIRDDAMTYLKERFMYGDLDKTPSPLETFKKSPELVKFKKWWAEREDNASGGRVSLTKGGLAHVLGV